VAGASSNKWNAAEGLANADLDPVNSNLNMKNKSKFINSKGFMSESNRPIG